MKGANKNCFSRNISNDEGTNVDYQKHNNRRRKKNKENINES